MNLKELREDEGPKWYPLQGRDEETAQGEINLRIRVVSTMQVTYSFSSALPIAYSSFLFCRIPRAMTWQWRQ